MVGLVGGGVGEGAAEGRLAGLTSEIIGGAMEVHRSLGPGLLESAYESCLAWELAERGLQVARQVPVPVHYKGVRMDCAYRLDLVINDAVVLELKTVSALAPIHTAQLLTYLRLTNLPVGLLLNFNSPTMKAGIKRISL